MIALLLTLMDRDVEGIAATIRDLLLTLLLAASCDMEDTSAVATPMLAAWWAAQGDEPEVPTVSGEEAEHLYRKAWVAGWKHGTTHPPHDEDGWWPDEWPATKLSWPRKLVVECGQATGYHSAQHALAMTEFFRKEQAKGGAS